MVLLAPNYPAGKDAINGFKRFYHGTIADEIYTSLDQTDFSAELARVRADQPDAVFEFLPGGLGINFLKQFSQAGLKSKMKLVLSAASLESRIVSATGDDTIGVYGTAHWVQDLPYPANKKFVCRLHCQIPSRSDAVRGDGLRHRARDRQRIARGRRRPDEGRCVRAALKKANFASVRGNFRFGSDQEPIEDWYSTQVVKRGGKNEIVTIGKVARDLGNAYTSLCPL